MPGRHDLNFDIVTWIGTSTDMIIVYITKYMIMKSQMKTLIRNIYGTHDSLNTPTHQLHI